MSKSFCKRLSCVFSVLLLLLIVSAVRPIVRAGWEFDGLFSYQVNADGTCTLMYFNGEAAGTDPRDLVIPQTLGGHQVVSIADSAFEGLNIFNSVVIPEGVTSIGNMAFYANSKCTSITFPSTLKRIGSQAFLANSFLTEVRLPKALEYVGSRAFYSASGRLHVYVYATTQYEADAFQNAQVTIIPNDDPTPSPSPTLMPINSGNFPDTAFVEYIRTTIDTDKDGFLSLDEREVVTGIQIDRKTVKSLKGVEYFPNLQILNIHKGELNELDVSQNTELKNLVCSSVSLKSLVLGNNKQLESIECSQNKLTSLNLSNCPKLKYLYCENNLLTSLDVSGCHDLLSLTSHFNNIAELKFATDSNVVSLITSDYRNPENHQFNEFDNGRNSLTYDFIASINVPNAGFYYREGAQVIPVNGTYFPDAVFRSYLLDSVDLNGDRKLAWNERAKVSYIDVSDSSAASLKGIEYFITMDELFCSRTQIKELDVSKNIWLKVLECSDNGMTSLKVCQGEELRQLLCYHNDLQYLDLSECINLPLEEDCLYEDDYVIYSGRRNGEENCKFACDYNLRVKFNGKEMIVKPKTTPTPTPVAEKTVEVGKSFQYSVEGVSNNSITWSVGNTAIATVNASGLVTAKSAGNTYLHVGLPDGTKIKCLVRVVYPALKIRYTEKTLHINQAFRFAVTGDAGQKITWSVGNTSVATVDQNGNVIGKTAANTYLYAKSADGRVAKCLLKIVDPGTLGINYTEKTIYMGQSFAFTAKNTGILKAMWSVGNSNVAKVDANGTVTTVSIGNTYLYLRTEDGRTAKCLLKIVPAGALSITYTEKTIKVGSSFQFTAKNVARQEVSWRVGNTAVATVDANGTVTGKSVANTYLYARTSDGREVRCLIKVVA